MKKISKIPLQKQLENVKKVIAEKKSKLPKIDASKLKQIPDEVKIGNKVHRYGPEVEAFEEVVRENSSEAMNRLRKFFKRN